MCCLVCGLIGVSARTLLRLRHPSHDLLNVLTTTRPRLLLTYLASDLLTHTKTSLFRLNAAPRASNAIGTPSVSSDPNSPAIPQRNDVTKNASSEGYLLLTAVITPAYKPYRKMNRHADGTVRAFAANTATAPSVAIAATAMVSDAPMKSSETPQSSVPIGDIRLAVTTRAATPTISSPPRSDRAPAEINRGR